MTTTQSWTTFTRYDPPKRSVRIEPNRLRKNEEFADIDTSLSAFQARHKRLLELEPLRKLALLDARANALGNQ
jgi:hypothetical protein